MIKVMISLDEARITKDNKYDLNLMWDCIDECFASRGIDCSGNGLYVGSGVETDFAYMGLAVLELAKTDWFMEYVKEWTWMNSDYSENKDDFVVANLIEPMREYISSLKNEQKIV